MDKERYNPVHEGLELPRVKFNDVLPECAVLFLGHPGVQVLGLIDMNCSPSSFPKGTL